MSQIRISVGEIVVTAALNESNTAEALWDALPLESEAHRWGDEVYFETPVRSSEEDARADVPTGAVAYWPPGNALCLFFGQQPYSPVNIVGQLDGDPNVLARVRDGEAVRVERI